MNKYGLFMFVSLLGGVAAAGTIVVKTAPVWELAKDPAAAEVTTKGLTFPQELVKDSCAFAAEATVEFGGEVKDMVLPLFAQRVGETGW